MVHLESGMLFINEKGRDYKATKRHGGTLDAIFVSEKRQAGSIPYHSNYRTFWKGETTQQKEHCFPRVSVGKDSQERMGIFETNDTDPRDGHCMAAV